MPATFVLSGVRSPRTYASSVVCSIRPPSQEFQFQIIVAKIAAASSTTTSGITSFRHAALGGCGRRSGSTGFIGALVVAAIVGPPFRFALQPKSTPCREGPADRKKKITCDDDA